MNVRTPTRERTAGSPVDERVRATGRTRTASIPTQAGAPERTDRRTSDGAQTASQRAYARREERLRKLVGGVRPARTAVPTGRAKFVLLIMVLLVGGLVATLWLSTAAAADSYRLQDARSDAATLTQRSEQLRQEVTQLASAPELARRAEELGMVRVQDPARLVVGPDGAVAVVGEPEAATAPAPPVPPAPPVAPAPQEPQPGLAQDEVGQAPATGNGGGNEDGNSAAPGTTAVTPDAGAAATTPSTANRAGADQDSLDQDGPDQDSTDQGGDAGGTD